MSFPRYPKYKDSGVEWLGEVPEGWDVGPLKRFSKLQTGMTPPTDDFGNYTDEDLFQWIRPEDLDETGKPTKASKFLTTQGWRLTRQIPAGATLICCIGTIGKSGITEDIVSTNQQITAAIPIANSRYLFYSITSARTELELASTGNVLRILNTERLGNICFPSPPRHEQEAIATFLDRETAKIDALVAEQENLIALLKEKRQAVISHAVTKGLDPTVPMKDSGIEWLGEVPDHWSLKRLKQLLKKSGLVRGPFGGDLKKEIFVDEGYKVYEQKNAIYKNFALGDSYISEQKYTEMQRFRVRKNDYILSCSGTIGKAYRIPSEAPDGIINQALLIIRFDDSIISIFSDWIFEANFFQLQILDNSQGGAMKNLVGMDIFTCIVLPVPPRSEQKAIAAYLDTETAKLDELTTEAQHTIDLLKERRSALISAAVTGKIDVRGYHVHSQPIT